MRPALLRTISVVLILAFLPLALLPARGQDKKGKITPALQPFIDDKSVAGVVAIVADKDNILAHESTGFLDLMAMLQMPLDALFWIASMTKPITGAALMMLVDEGKVKLDDPVEKFLPEFKGQWMIVEPGKERLVLGKSKRPITVRDVMNHTSGMPFRSAMEVPTIDVLPLKDAVRSYALTPLNSEPGTKYVYSNAGINTGGRIIEVVSGMPYEEFLDKRLFGPLGMKDTTFWPSEAQLKRLAKTYKPVDGELKEQSITALRYPLSDKTHRYACPGGGLFSTASDCAVFCQMIAGGGMYKGKRYLSEDAVKDLTSQQTAKGLTGYGVGWSVGAGGAVGHGGAYATNMTVDTKHGLVMVFMVQHTGGGNIGKCSAAFRKAAVDTFGTK